MKRTAIVEETLGKIEKELWEVKLELSSLAFLLQGLNGEDSGAELFGLGLLLKRHAETLGRIEQAVVSLFQR